VLTVSTIVVDNGEPTLEECIESIRSQSYPVSEIILVASPKTNLELAHRLADRVIGPVDYIGYGRYLGILEASGEIIMSADSDTVYDKDYLRYAVEDIERSCEAVFAGSVYRYGFLELVDLVYFSVYGALEFGTVFLRDRALQVIDPEWLLEDPRRDILPFLRKLNTCVDPRMVCYTRLPVASTLRAGSTAVGIALAGFIALVLHRARAERSTA